MKPVKKGPAHHSDGFGELVCSNSLRGDALENAPGLLKEELRRVGSLILECADKTRVPAGGALAVDREGFSAMITTMDESPFFFFLCLIPLYHKNRKIARDAGNSL